MKGSLEIAQETTLTPITEIATHIGLQAGEFENQGDWVAKVRFPQVLERLPERREGSKYVLVTGITPTPLGEGKTVHTIGLTQALARLGKKAVACLRQPSMGPVFGIKGGATGGGYSQVLPMEDINLGLTGDIDRVASAHNLLAALLDNHLLKGNKLGIDVNQVLLRRVMDMNDRVLRDIVVGLGGSKNGVPRQTGFDIAAASEVMAILALAHNYTDLRDRLGKIVVAYSTDGEPVTSEDLRAAGVMAAILKHALKPNLVQTLEGQPCLMHAGPFANIAHGCSSIIADEVALRLGDYVVTEAGFGADLGAEKFFDIKCRQSGLSPDAVVLVASVRALKMHGGAYSVVPGKPIPKCLLEQEDVESVRRGCENLLRHVNNLRKFGLPVVVAVNTFASDTEAELAVVREEALRGDVADVVATRLFLEGGAGGEELAKAVVRAADQPKSFQPLYPPDIPLRRKVELVCSEIYGASDVRFSQDVLNRLQQFENDGFGDLPICMAKTHLSLSDNPVLKGDPSKRGFVVEITDVRLSAGAGFVYPIAGSMLTMPGLPPSPSSENIDLDKDGRITGLF